MNEKISLPKFWSTAGKIVENIFKYKGRKRYIVSLYWEHFSAQIMLFVAASKALNIYSWFILFLLCEGFFIYFFKKMVSTWISQMLQLKSNMKYFYKVMIIYGNKVPPSISLQVKYAFTVHITFFAGIQNRH